MSIIVMTDDDFEKNMQRLADQFHPLLAASFRARDTAQREALAQLQAEMPDLRANMTKALDLLQVLTSTKYTHRAFVEAVDEADEMLEQLRGKVVMKGLADQQEAQGAQAGEFQREDRYLVIKRKDLDLLSPTDRDLALTLMGELSAIMATWNAPERQYLVVESDWPEFEPTWAAIQARVEGRAALATQPAAGEPIGKVELFGINMTYVEWRDRKMPPLGTEIYAAPPAAAPVAAGEPVAFANELISGALQGGDFSGADIQELAVKHGLLREERREEPCRDEGCACAEYGFPTECYRKTAALAPPAAAHGDEAVRKDAEYFRFIESCPIRTGVVLSRKAHEAGFDLRAECERVMAMRAQGDGEVQ